MQDIKSSITPVNQEKPGDHIGQYEVHIVDYHSADLNTVPAPFFLNRVLGISSSKVTGIATVECHDLEVAYRVFELGCQWSEQQMRIQPNFGVHVKLEQITDSQNFCDQHMIDLKEIVQPHLRIQPTPIVAAWDVHLDGVVSPALRTYLVHRGYIEMDYIATDGKPITTLTMHFLKPLEAMQEFVAMKNVLAQNPGFNGQLYTEDPLAFVVYGQTEPRPIVMAVE